MLNHEKQVAFEPIALASTWLSLNAIQKDFAVALFQQAIAENSDLVVEFNDELDEQVADSNRVESFFFGTSADKNLMMVRVLQEPVALCREKLINECEVLTLTDYAFAYMSHSMPVKNPVTCQIFEYAHQAWLTQKGAKILQQCMSKAHFIVGKI